MHIWPGPTSEFKKFLKYLNEAHPTIKFTSEYSNTNVNFLDITIYKGPRYKTSLVLDIKPFFKPTNKSSAHPRNIFKSLIEGELTRLLRACSDKETFENVTNKLLKALAERGYPNQLLQDTLQQVPFERRTKILEGKEKEEIKYDTFFKIDYTPDLNSKKLRQIIQPHKDEGSNIPHPCVSLKKKDNLAKKNWSVLN